MFEEAPEQDYFLAAATACAGIGARPRDYVLAQFEKFKEYSKRGRKRGKRALYPQPCHLHTPGAQQRYLEFLALQTQRERRAAPKLPVCFRLEEKKLRGLVRMLRLPEGEVLTERPEEFSPEYLQHRHVWELVETVYDARVN